MSYYHAQHPNRAYVPLPNSHYHQLPASMLQPDMSSGPTQTQTQTHSQHGQHQQQQQQQQRSPCSPYTNPSATPTTAHQQSQMRYQQQQQQHYHASPYPNRSPPIQYAEPPQLQYHVQTQPRSPPPTTAHTAMTSKTGHTAAYHAAPAQTTNTTTATTLTAASTNENNSNHVLFSNSSSTDSAEQITTPPCESQSEFPDTLPVLHPNLNQTASSDFHDNNIEHEQKKEEQEDDDTQQQQQQQQPIAHLDKLKLAIQNIDLGPQSDDEPIPNDDDEKMTSPLMPSKDSTSMMQSIEEEIDIPDLNLLMSEIDEEMQLPATAQQHSKTPSPPVVSRSSSHPLRINMGAPIINPPFATHKSSGTSSMTSPVHTGDVSYSHSYLTSPPHLRLKVQMPDTMISCSSTATTPLTGAAASPVTPNRISSSSSSSYHAYSSQQPYATTPVGYHRGTHLHSRKNPLSVTTTPLSYQYQQRSLSQNVSPYSLVNHAHLQNSRQNSSSSSSTTATSNNHQNHRNYPQTPNHHPSKAAYHSLPAIPGSTSLYQSHSSGHQQLSPYSMSSYSHSPSHSHQHAGPQQQQHHRSMMGSQTPTPNMLHRPRSKSVAITTTSSASNQHSQSAHTASPQFHSHSHPHRGSMTPQHHSSRNRRHTMHHSQVYENQHHHHHAGNHHNSIGGNYHNYNKHSRTEKIYNLLQQHGNRMKFSTFQSLYPQQFHEMLPASRDNNNLLKYLVQFPRILVIKCLKEEDLMIFYCESSSHRTVIDILRHDQELFDKENNANASNGNNHVEYKGMKINQFTQRLAEKLNITDLSEYNIVDFLERWRMVELVENNQYVRLMPMGCCTVFLGNLNPTQWNEGKVRNILTQINPSWYNLRVRLNLTNYGLLNAFIDFKSMEQAQGAIERIKNSLRLFELNNNNGGGNHGNNSHYMSSPTAMQQQQQQQVQIQVPHSTHSRNDNTNYDNYNMQMSSNQAAVSGPGSPMQHGIRVEIEQASAHKNHPNYGHVHNNGHYNHSYYHQYGAHTPAGYQSPIPEANMAHSPNQPHHQTHQHYHPQAHHHQNQHNQNTNNMHTQPSTPHTPSNNNNRKMHTPPSGKKSNDNNNNGNNKNSNFNQITNNIYKLIRDHHGGKILMSVIAEEYKKLFAKELHGFDGNPKYFVRFERLLLLNCAASEDDDVMIFFTPEPAYKLVVTILKQNPSGLSIEEFKDVLERRMNMSLEGCDFNDFLNRWRFLSIRETKDNKKTVLFTPHSGSTVFFGNLNVECTETDIYSDLESANPKWKHSSVRLKLGKGFAYAFVDFPTRQDAMDAVQHFDGKSAFKSKYVSADIEQMEQRKRHQNNGHHNKDSNHNNNGNHKNNQKRNRSYSYDQYNSNMRDRRHSGANNTRQFNNNGNGNNMNRGGNMMNNNNNNNNNKQWHRNSVGGDNHSNNNNSNSNGNNNGQSGKTTVYLGNLRDDVTKNDIQTELGMFNEDWNNLTIRLNLRSGWSHAFVDFELAVDARKLINAWNNRPNSLTNTRLRCEISKRQM